MKEPERGEQIVRFGVFELDLRSGELRKAGLRIKLQDQPFKVLAALLENPGQLVTREELRSRIWPKESFGDFDHAVHIAIAKLRIALGDSAEAPRFIETLHRRGYRFIFPIATAGSAEQGASLAAAVPLSVPAVGETRSGIVTSDTTTASTLAATSGDHQWRWIIAVFIVLLASVGTLFWASRPFPAPKVIRTVQITHDGFDKMNTLSDGSRLYITESTGSRQFLVQVSAAGGETSVIPTPFASIAISDISPDHSQMLVADAIGTENESQIWVLPLPTGMPRRLGDIAAHWNLWASGWAVWSPDGQRIAFSTGSEIDIMKADGTDARKLISVSGAAEQMRFSPAGTHLRFSLKTANSESRSIWEVRADGSGLHLLLPDQPTGFSDLAGDWTPDGGYYFFTRCGSPNSCGIWTRREPQGFLHRWPSPPPVQLTVGPTPVFFNAVSRDGRSIFAGEWTSRGELIRYDAKSRQFLPFLTGLNAEQPDFSRDGQWVAFVSDADQTLWRCRIDGSERMQLSSPGVSASQPRWSPDGKQIAYVNQHAGAFSQIYLVSSEGGASQHLFSENQNQLDPSWSSDGTHLAFGGAPWLKAPVEKINIQIFDLGSKKISAIPDSENLFSPRWSPDGRYLAAVSNDTKKLFLFDFTTKEWINWIDEPGAVAFPIWSVDGRFLFFDNISSENPGYRRARVGQNHSELVVSLTDIHRGIASPAGPWSGMAPDDSPLFERDLSTGEIYSLELELP